MQPQPIQQDPHAYKTEDMYVRGVMGQQQDSSFLMYQLETEEILEEVEMNLRGYDWDIIQRRYIQKDKGLVNDKGIAVLMALLKSEVNKTKILSDYSEEDIALIMEEFANNLVDVLVANYKEWNIDFSLLSSVRIIIDNAVYSTYKRAREGGERKFLKGDVRRVETYAEKEGKGLLSSLMPRSKTKW